jgi:hypothetical protein
MVCFPPNSAWFPLCVQWFAALAALVASDEFMHVHPNWKEHNYHVHCYRML